MSSSDGYPDNNPKTIYGVAKPPLNLIPAPALLHVAMAFGDGARKYGPYNWREKTVSSSVYVAAAMRHLASWQDGEEYDPVSGVHHLGHAMACMSIILDAQAVSNLNDDRPAPAPTAEMIIKMTRKNAAPAEVDLGLVDHWRDKVCAAGLGKDAEMAGILIQEAIRDAEAKPNKVEAEEVVPTPPAARCRCCGHENGEHAGWCGERNEP